MPFVKGQSGNPGGRIQPKGVGRVFREQLLAYRDVENPAADGLSLLAERLMKIAMTGEHKDSVAAIKVALAYIVGQPTQHVAVDVSANGTSEVDWELLPLEERKQLRDAALKLKALVEATAAADGDERN